MVNARTYKPGFDPEWLDYVEEIIGYVNDGSFDPYANGMKEIAEAMTSRVNTLAAMHPEVEAVAPIPSAFNRTNMKVGGTYLLKSSRGGGAWWSGIEVWVTKLNPTTFSAKAMSGKNAGSRCKIHYSTVERRVDG